MGTGDIVIYLPDPLLFGRLLVVYEDADCRLVCQPMDWDDDEQVIGSFDPAELEHHHAWQTVKL